MEISALSSSLSLPLPPPSRFSSPLSPFSDQSHLQFYGSGLRPSVPVSFFTHLSRRSLHSPAPARFKQLLAATQYVGDACPPALPSEVADEQDLVKELADLKAQLKQKKKELKAQTKELKKALIPQKQKMKKPKDCSSSSSSESESSDCECESADMEVLRTEQVASTESGLQDAVEDSVMTEATLRDPSSEILGQESTQSSSAVLPVESSGDYFSFSSKASKVAGKIEVCVGGKCKKAGSEQLLSSLRAKIPSDSAVEALPCKCMGNCKMSINVKVHKEETNPLHHSHVGIQNAGLLLSHHFKLGPPSSGLPSLGPHAKPVLAPQRLTATF